MLGAVEPTDYDLRFQLLGIPIRVSVWFWLAAVILGYESIHAGVEYLLAWVLILFVSILAHELGHALAARSFGYPPSILLYHFGGLASFHPTHNDTRGKSILISLAGPGAGFLVYGATVLWLQTVGLRLLPALSEGTLNLVGFTVQNLIWVNLWWGLVNLLPVLPLDGGRICQELCGGRTSRAGLEKTFLIGMIVAGVAAAAFFNMQLEYAGMMFAMLCASNVMSWQQVRRL